MPSSKSKEERMWKLAYQMADSGKYNNWLEIEWELRGQGYSRARQLLDDEATRERFDNRCAEAKSKIKVSN